jgi:hypothetical protein
MSDDNPLNSAECTTGRTIYPYLVIRVFAAVYQRERIRIQTGPPLVELVYRRSVVQHPVPFAADGTTLNPDCRALLTHGVQAAVRGLGFRMWIVWAKSSCTSVEADRMSPAGEPSGGLPVAIEFTPQHHEPTEPVG